MLAKSRSGWLIYPATGAARAMMIILFITRHFRLKHENLKRQLKDIRTIISYFNFLFFV